MKDILSYLKILFCFVLLCTTQLAGFANAKVLTDPTKQQGQDGRNGLKKNDAQMLDGEEKDELFQEDENQEEASRLASIEKKEAEFEEAEKDTVEDESVSKYNFLFYFLYKYKSED